MSVESNIEGTMPTKLEMFNYSCILPSTVADALAEHWLEEDCSTFDHGAMAVGTTPATGVLYLKSAGVLAGVPFFEAVMRTVGCSVKWEASATEGTSLECSVGRLALATVRGPACELLRGERVALNALAECSGVATAARRAAALAKQMGWRGRVACTRKTTPGFRLPQKYGTIVGGMDAHRFDLGGMVMLKDNHVQVARNVREAVRRVRSSAGFSVKIEVECSSTEEALAAARAGADVVMLDNFDVAGFAEAARCVKGRFPNVIVEGSGGLNFDNLRNYMIPEVDVLSFSVNRHAVPLDMSMKIEM